MIILRKPEYVTAKARSNWRSRLNTTCRLAKEAGMKVIVRVKAETRKA